MLSRLRDIFQPKPKRSLDGGASGPRWESAHTISNLNSAAMAGGSLLSRRAMYAAINNPVAAAGARSLVSNLVGNGFKPQSLHKSKARAEKLEQAFADWAYDTGNGLPFNAFMSLAVREMICTGEVLVRIILGAKPRLELIHADQMPMDLNKDFPDARRVRAGVEFDRSGKRLAYHLYKSRPGDVVQPMHSLETVRVPAEFIAHMFEPLSPGQVRGISWFAPIMLLLHEHSQLQDAALVKQKVAALFAGVLTDLDGQGSPLNDNVSGGTAMPSLEPGAIIPLQPGQDIRFPSLPSTTDYPDFVKAQLRSIAAGLGLTYEQLTGDLEGVSYSSIRAGLVEFRRRAEQIQQTLIIPQLCRPVWNWFVQSQVLLGRFPASDIENMRKAQWLPPAWDWVDPLKDQQAEQLAVEAGFKSRRQVVAESGRDIEEVDAEIAADVMKNSMNKRDSENERAE